jgi:hypothetical protein
MEVPGRGILNMELSKSWQRYIWPSRWLTMKMFGFEIKIHIMSCFHHKFAAANDFVISYVKIIALKADYKILKL